MNASGFVDLLRALSEAHGAPGAEQDVRDVFRARTTGDVLSDALGSIYIARPGAAPGPRVLLAGHLDEVGFAVQSITQDGTLRFAPLGGVWSQVLLSQRVRIRRDDGSEVIGVVAAKPPHFLSEEERAKLVRQEDMVIDVGAGDEAEVRSVYGIRLGQPVVFDSPFTVLLNGDRVLGKAFDNRVGVALAAAASSELVEGNHPGTVFCGASAQEEVGGRGACTSAALLEPDVAIVLEGTPADDAPKAGADACQGALGRGVQIRLLDPSAIMNRALTDLLCRVADREGIAHQIAVRRNGGTDAARLHVHSRGVPTAVLGVPVRNPHTANSLLDVNDALAALRLVLAVVRELDAETVAAMTRF